MAVPEEEAKGIDGYIGDIPISIKPQTYESKQMLPSFSSKAWVWTQ